MARLNSLLVKRRASGAMVEPASREPMATGRRRARPRPFPRRLARRTRRRRRTAGRCAGLAAAAIDSILGFGFLSGPGHQARPG